MLRAISARDTATECIAVTLRCPKQTCSQRQCNDEPFVSRVLIRSALASGVQLGDSLNVHCASPPSVSTPRCIPKATTDMQIGLSMVRFNSNPWASQASCSARASSRAPPTPHA